MYDDFNHVAIFMLTRYCEMFGSTPIFSSNNIGPRLESVNFCEIAMVQVHLPSGWKVLRLNDEACAIQIDVR